jgi:hypothetical protein
MSRQVLQMMVALIGLAISCETSEASKRIAPPPPRFPFKIEPNTPLADLLPPLPETTAKLPGVLNVDLTLVPELTFAKPLAKDLEFLKSQEATAHQMAKINHLNQKREDGFMHAYLDKRPDLRGLPFLMGKECRTDEKQAAVFRDVVRGVRLCLEISDDRDGTVKVNESTVAARFWKSIGSIEKRRNDTKVMDDEIASLVRLDKGAADRSLVAALMQMCTPMSEPFRLGLAKYLASVDNADATIALVKLALYSPEDTIRAAAIEGLKSRPTKQHGPILLSGLRYPLPMVAKNAAEALVKTQNKDVVDELVRVLEEPDPRAPVAKKADGKDVTFVREMVRVNHHHNCLLCHAPANTADVPKDVLSAPVPQPGQRLPSVFQGYGSRQSPDIFVRTDMNYLRQDFSVMMKVEDAKPWPEMQRFDFFVRTREVNTAEAADIAKALAKQTPPNHVAAQYALRELTGRSPQNVTPQGWREVLMNEAPK